MSRPGARKTTPQIDETASRNASSGMRRLSARPTPPTTANGSTCTAAPSSQRRISLPRKLAGESAGGTALTLSLLAAVLLLPAFWSGLPLALGVAGAILGYAGQKSVRGSAKCIAALVIGMLASIGYFAVYVLDALHRSGVAWA